MTDSKRIRFPPPDDKPMLPWYGGAYSHGFIAFHPFFKVDGLDPNTCDYGTLVIARSDFPNAVGFLEWTDHQAEERRKGKEVTGDSIAEIAKRFGEKISWQSIRKQVGLPDDRSVDRALRTHIKGLKRELEDQDAAKRLASHCERQQIFFPTEGGFQATMESDLVATLQRAGLTEILVGDEFGEDEILLPLESLADPLTWQARVDMPRWGARRLIATDYSLLVWVHWDSFYTAIFGTSERIGASRVAENFEGLWCTSETTTYWLMDETRVP